MGYGGTAHSRRPPPGSPRRLGRLCRAAALRGSENRSRKSPRQSNDLILSTSMNRCAAASGDILEETTLPPGQEMDHSRTESLAAELLGVSSVQDLVRSQLARSVLPGGRVEAQEFGRDQHSSASAGGVLIGLAGCPCVRDQLIAPLARLVGDLVDDTGQVRPHDGNRRNGDSTWAEAQILLGLLIRPHLSDIPAKITALVGRLTALQDGSGGWPLRTGGEPSPTFTFYPVLALAQAVRLGFRTGEATPALHAAGRFLDQQLASAALRAEERVLAQFALERAAASTGTALGPAALGRRAELLSSCWSAQAGIRLHDQQITIHDQPVWHTVTWRPLLYLCLRKWTPPLGPVATVLGAELIDSFDAGISAWHGPASNRNAAGTSWASALALRATIAFAHDLRLNGHTPAEFRARHTELTSGKYAYDVAISFAGTDRGTAETISRHLQAAGLRVFYDRDYQHALLGEDLTSLLQNTYFSASRFAVVLVSHAFLRSRWAGNWEWRAVLARMQQQTSGYVLPYLLDKVEIPGLSPTIGYASATQFSASEFADLVIRKVREARSNLDQEPDGNR
ncbi:TIR domain-containing protein [Amycolatopsis sp. MEPSY49]|uniref:TIR domain-containing protein n=1 Tax=Amycolatopsis sp. MEPSY49 TaxID=3151600 RepID=UPI003EF673AB